MCFDEVHCTKFASMRPESSIHTLYAIEECFCTLCNRWWRKCECISTHKMFTYQIFSHVAQIGFEYYGFAGFPYILEENLVYPMCSDESFGILKFWSASFKSFTCIRTICQNMFPYLMLIISFSCKVDESHFNSVMHQWQIAVLFLNDNGFMHCLSARLKWYTHEMRLC